MDLSWIHETSPRWDARKAAIVGEAPAGVFDSRYRRLRDGESVPGEWWRVESGGQVIAFGWMDVCWGDAEILLAVDPRARRGGVGRFVLDRLHEEARRRGLNYLTNIVRPTHPQRAEVTAWLEKQGFRDSDDGRLVCSVHRAG
ncbi:MAG TPA: GNAT family N-acetyltransferase [Polyangia bacterium]|nr:GNAT family N-acetyltransferase [Polyangia bacterium]